MRKIDSDGDDLLQSSYHIFVMFSMEVNYGHMLDSELHMQRHLVGARGKATSFVLPWEALLKEFRRSEVDIIAKRVPLLPRVGQELADVVQVLFKLMTTMHRCA